MNSSRPSARTSISLSWDPEAGDVLGLRSVTWDGQGQLGVRVTLNVPQELWLWPDVGLSWARSSREACTLALAVLDRTLGGGRDRVCDLWHRPLACCTWAYRLAWSFAQDFLLPAPYWHLRLPGATIRGWISDSIDSWHSPRVDLGLVEPAMHWPVYLP